MHFMPFKPIGAVALAAALVLADATFEADELVAPGAWKPREGPEGWNIVETDRLHVQSQISQAKTNRLVEHVEAMVGLYASVLPARHAPRNLVVKLFEDQTSFENYGRRVPGVLAYADLSVPEIVAYDGGRLLAQRDIPARIRFAPRASVVLMPDERAAIETLFEDITDAYVHDLADSLGHEVWHLYFNAVSNGRPIPLWLDEGLADVFAPARPLGSDAPAPLDAEQLNVHRLRDVRRAVIERDTIALRALIYFDARDFARDPQLAYAMSWAFTHFLVHHEEPRRRAIVPAILKGLIDGIDPETATREVFADADIDFELLEREWKVWVRTRPLHDPLEELAERFGDRLAPEDLAAPEHWIEMYAWYVSRR